MSVVWVETEVRRWSRDDRCFCGCTKDEHEDGGPGCSFYAAVAPPIIEYSLSPVASGTEGEDG